MSFNGHVVGIHYDLSKQQWKLFDANNIELDRYWQLPKLVRRLQSLALTYQVEAKLAIFMQNHAIKLWLLRWLNSVIANFLMGLLILLS